MTDAGLYARGAATLVASWEQYARGSPGAAVERASGVAAATFPAEPERAVYNNALLDRDIDRADQRTAVDAMEAAYRTAGIDRYAAWVHESDGAMRCELGERGYTVAESTRAMGMAVESVSATPSGIEIQPADWAEHLRIIGAPAGLLGAGDMSAFEILVARHDGENVATAIAFDHDGDCGLFNLGTLERARRRGLGTALTARLLRDATERGCSTASVQSTPAAERVYSAVGFRDLGRFLEYVPYESV